MLPRAPRICEWAAEKWFQYREETGERLEQTMVQFPLR